MGTGSGNEYSDQSYWDERYKTTVTTLFDWYNNYQGLKPFLTGLLKRTGKNASEVRVLNLGCGNSPLCEHMYDDGYENIDNIDYSQNCIEYMQERNNETRPGLKFWQADARKMKLDAGAYDLILDKGLIDSLMCGASSLAGIESMCAAVSKALSASGSYVVMTYGPPEDRVHLLRNDAFGWEVEVFCLRKPNPDVTEQEIHEPVPWWGGEGVEKADGGHGVHYLYLMRKKHGESSSSAARPPPVGSSAGAAAVPPPPGTTEEDGASKNGDRRTSAATTSTTGPEAAAAVGELSSQH